MTPWVNEVKRCPPINRAIFHDMRASRPNTVLLPRLRCLNVSYNKHSILCPEEICPFLTPELIAIHFVAVGAGCGGEVQLEPKVVPAPVLEAIRSTCTSLRTVTVRAACRHHFEHGLQLLPTELPVETLKISNGLGLDFLPLDQGVLLRLPAMENLKKLRLQCHFDASFKLKGSSPFLLPAIEDIDLEVLDPAVAHLFLSALDKARLRVFDLRIYTPFGADVLEGLLAALDDCRPFGSLTDLSIQSSIRIYRNVSYSPPPSAMNPLSRSTLERITHPSLRTLDLRCKGGFDMDDAVLLGLGSACPRLRSITLKGEASMTHVTPRGMLQFTQACPELESMTMAVGISLEPYSSEILFDPTDDITHRIREGREWPEDSARLVRDIRRKAVFNNTHFSGYRVEGLLFPGDLDL